MATRNNHLTYYILTTCNNSQNRNLSLRVRLWRTWQSHQRLAPPPVGGVLLTNELRTMPVRRLVLRSLGEGGSLSEGGNYEQKSTKNGQPTT